MIIASILKTVSCESEMNWRVNIISIHNQYLFEVIKSNDQLMIYLSEIWSVQSELTQYTK